MCTLLSLLSLYMYNQCQVYSRFLGSLGFDFSYQTLTTTLLTTYQRKIWGYKNKQQNSVTTVISLIINLQGSGSTSLTIFLYTHICQTCKKEICDPGVMEKLSTNDFS